MAEKDKKDNTELSIKCHNNMKFTDIMFGFIKEQKTFFFIYFLILLTLPIKDIIFPRLIGNLYSSIKEGKEFFTVGAFIIGIIIFLQIIGTVSDYIELQLHPAIYKYVRVQIMNHLFKIKETSYSDVEIGVIISKMIRLPGMIHAHMENIRGVLIPSALTIICITAYIFYLDWKLGIPLLVVIGIFLSTLYLSIDKCGSEALKRDENFSLLTSTMDDILRNMMTVISFDKKGEEEETLNEIHDTYAKHTLDTMYCTLYSKYITVPSMLAYILFVCYYSHSKMKSKKITSEIFVTLLIMSFIIMGIIFTIVNIWKDILFREGVIQNSLRTFEECDVRREVYTKPAERKDTLRFQDIRFSYITTETERPVLTNFTLDINLNETTLFLGEIGSGKSTIISLILKYQTPQDGEIFLKGVPYSELSPLEIRKRIMYIPQTPILLNRSVYENITYGISPCPSKENVAKLIREMELDRFLDNLPLGVDTNVGVNGNKLSGGQRQIIWVLKAFLINPEIVIMDEPTAAVDEKTKEIIHYLLEKIVNKKTVIMITHDPYLLKFAKRIITLENGVVVKDTREGEGQGQAHAQAQGQGQGQHTLEKNPLLKKFQHRLISRPW